jgi:hypothetical protein
MFVLAVAVLAGQLAITISPIVGVVVAGLILAGLAALRSANSKAPTRVPVRVRTEEPRRRRRR